MYFSTYSNKATPRDERILIIMLNGVVVSYTGNSLTDEVRVNLISSIISIGITYIITLRHTMFNFMAYIVSLF